MKKYLLFLAITLGGITLVCSCSRNKITCPTYADSFPDKKKKTENKPQLPKPTKPKSGVLPKGYGK
ncbi:MAG: hypothetical protein NZM35_08225 [Chitinophagales bacterium]|nr:hypothetical protein [Chitinophagales bacterium]MDW8419613.1 hypothetical protein [Chitinophagales bacterium]